MLLVSHSDTSQHKRHLEVRLHFQSLKNKDAFRMRDFLC